MNNFNLITTNTYSYKEAKKYQRKSKEQAVNQFIKFFLLNRDYKSQNNNHLLHGFEIEKFIIREQRDSAQNLSYALNNEAHYIFEKPYQKEHFDIKNEGLSAQIEITPREPYKHFLFGKPILDCCKLFYQDITEHLEPGDEIFLCCHFQAFGSKANLKHLGFEGMSPEEISQANIITQSSYNSDKIIFDGPRQLRGIQNLRLRRGETIPIHIPLFKDEKTKMEHQDHYEPLPGFVTIHCCSTSLSYCSTQITFSHRDIKQARWSHDQLHILAPLIVKNFLNYFRAASQPQLQFIS